MATVRVKLLDDTSRSYNVKPKSIASVLIQDIMKDLDVLESDYFGILYNHEGEKTFLDPLKPLNKQIHSFNKELQFVVKFFPPDPGQLQEEYTRYLFALQMKRDLLAGLMTCGENTSLVMASLIVQEDFGEWNSAECSDIEYLKDIKILPSPTPGQLCAVLDLHKKLVNSSYSDTDYKLLDVARRLEHYGIRMHPARDHENTDINLAVNHAGLLVFQGMTKMNNFNWSRIRKLSFKRKRFLIKLRTESQKQNNEVGDILVFVMKSRNACKNFWRICIEYHAFFRLDQRPNPPPKPVLLSRGSSFRYRGKTQKELITLVRESNFRRTEFVRSKSSRRPPRPNHNEATPVRRHSNSFVPSPVAPLTVDIPPSSPPPDYSSHLVQSSVSQPREHAVSSSQISPVKHHEQSPVKVELERPEWREESKSLHSSATPIPTVDDNQSAAVEGTAPTSHSTNNNNSLLQNKPPLHDISMGNKSVAKLSIVRNDSLQNDSRVKQSLQRSNSKQKTQNKSILSNNIDLTGFDSFCWKQDITGFGTDILKQCHINMTPNPPPIPPKLRSPTRNTTQSTHVRDSVISTASTISQAVHNSESNVERSERKIDEGFYAQPRKLPELTCTSLSPLLRHARSFELDPDLKELLKNQNIFESTSLEDADNSMDGQLGVVIDSGDEFIDPESNPLLEPIEMKFDDESLYNAA